MLEVSLYEEKGLNIAKADQITIRHESAIILDMGVKNQKFQKWSKHFENNIFLQYFWSYTELC